MHFTVEPQSALIDTPLSIHVTGLAPQQTLSIRASMRDGAGIEWQYKRSYEADDSGELHLEHKSPLSENDSMALIAMMNPVDNENQNRRFAHGKNLSPLTIQFELRAEDSLLSQASVERTYLAPGVTRTEIRENGLVGTLFLPESDEPCPVITLLGGSSGQMPEVQAALLAAHGYAALALAYFNHEGLPPLMVDIPLEYFEKSIQYLQSDPGIDSNRMAVYGKSRGGELALLLGATFSEYSAIIADVPSGVLWGGFGNNLEEGNKPAWTYRGEALPYMDTPFDASLYDYYEDYKQRGEAIPATPVYEANLDLHPEIAAAAEIPVERIQAPVLMFSGQSDQLWCSQRMSDIAMARLERHNFSYDYDHIAYPDAGHFIPFPYVPTTVNAIKHPVAGTFFDYGGNAEGSYRAGVDAWQRILAFLHTHLS